MKRYFIIFRGRVQGVGFRYFVYKEANRLDLKGYVKNLANGHVEAEIEGKEEDIDRLLAKILENKGYIKVEDYSLKKVKLKENESKFSIRY